MDCLPASTTRLCNDHQRYAQACCTSDDVTVRNDRRDAVTVGDAVLSPSGASSLGPESDSWEEDHTRNFVRSYDVDRDEVKVLDCGTARAHGIGSYSLTSRKGQKIPAGWREEHHRSRRRGGLVCHCIYLPDTTSPYLSVSLVCVALSLSPSPTLFLSQRRSFLPPGY